MQLAFDVLACAQRLSFNVHLDIPNICFFQDDNDCIILGSFHRGAYVEDFWDILHRVHYAEKPHLGYKKTLAEVRQFKTSDPILYLNILLFKGFLIL